MMYTSKVIFSRTAKALISHFNMQASSGSTGSSLFKLWPPGVGWVYNRESKFYLVIYSEKSLLKKFFSWTVRGVSSGSADLKSLKSMTVGVGWDHYRILKFYLGIYRKNL